jgi:hypothetical protein
MFLPLALSALSLSAQNSPTNALPPLVPAYGEIPPTFWEQHGNAILIIGLGLIALAGAVTWVILRPQPPVVVPPEVLARETLAKLRRQPENGQVLSEISQTLRRYLLAAFRLPAGERTTSEFCATLAGSEKVGAELAQAVASFLRESDQRKFAPVNAAAPFEAASRALEIIDQAELRAKQSMIPTLSQT